MGRPIEVYMNDIILTENNDFKYKNNYLYIRSKSSENNNIALVWNDSIGQEDIMFDSTNMILIDDNINDESNNINEFNNDIFSDKLDKNLTKENTEEIFIDLSTNTPNNNRQRRLNEYDTDSIEANNNENKEEKFLIDKLEEKKETSKTIINNNDNEDLFITYKTNDFDLMSDSTLNTENIFETNPPSTIFEEHIEIKKINLNAENMFKDCEEQLILNFLIQQEYII